VRNLFHVLLEFGDILCGCKIESFFFFFLSINRIYQKRRRAQPLVHRSIQGGLGRGGEERKKIYKANGPQDKPACSPSIEGKKKEMEELLSRPRQILKIFIIMLHSNTPHNTMRDQLPNNSAPRTASRPPTRK
jgi:hypothetical protein